MLYSLHVILTASKKTMPIASGREITTMSNAIPQDSILRRHYEQMAVSRGLPGAVPEDSILARHYAQMMAAGSNSTAAATATATVAPASAPPAPAASAAATPPAPASTTHSAPTKPTPTTPAPQKGFFARLLDTLFGRS
jgi:membrane protease subunit (stomatin/prohibitin family)